MAAEMEKEQKKAYLKGYLAVKKREKLISERIRQLRSGRMFPCVQNDGMPHARNRSDLSAYAARLDELEKRLEQERAEGVRQYKLIERSIQSIEDERGLEVMERRYLQGQRWDEIADEMNYSRRGVIKIHDRAIKIMKI